MLNVCINRRRVREGNLSGAMLKSNQRNLESRSDDSDDEFFDCDANNEDDVAGQTAYDEWNKPEGRMAKLDGMKLIDSDEYLYVPITQDPVPKTEDQLEDDAEILLKLGPDSGEILKFIWPYCARSCRNFCFNLFCRTSTNILTSIHAFRFYHLMLFPTFRASNANHECITVIGYGKF